MITIYLKQYNKIIRNADTKLFDDLGYDDILWIDMLLPTIKEQKAVENFMEISLQTKQQVEEIESTSKYSETENAIISNSNFFVPTGESFLVEPVSFIISNEGVLVSVRNAEFRTFRETEKRLQMNYRSYSTGYHVFISLLEVRIDFDADLVELVSKQVGTLSKDINSEDAIDKAVLHRISALQESTMSLRENIFDRQRVLSGILRSERFPSDIYPRLQLMIKTRRAKKRLTSPLFLERYAQLLRPDGWLNLKTDSKHLYAYTNEVIRRFALPCEVSEPDIYGSGFADETLSVKTAYETLFLEKGLPITYTRFSLGGRRDFPWFDWEEDQKLEKDNEEERRR